MYIVLVWTLSFVHAQDGSLTWLKGWAGNDSIVSLSPVGTVWDTVCLVFINTTNIVEGVAHVGTWNNWVC